MGSAAAVAILNGYSADNLGDWLLIEASVDLARTRHPGEDIVVVALDPRSLTSKCAAAEVLEAPFSLQRSPWWSVTGVVLAYATRCRMGPRRLRRLRTITSAYSVGGGFLQIRSLRELASVSVAHVTQLLLMRRAKVPIIMLPQSVGPFNGWLARLGARQVLRMFAEVVVREHRSLEHVRELDPSRAARATQAADLAFWPGLRRRSVSVPPADSAPGGGWRVALVIRQWWFPGSADPVGESERYLSMFARLADRLTEQGHTVAMILHSTGPTHRGNDGIATADVIRRMSGAKPSVVDLQHYGSLAETEARYGMFDVVVSTRLHAALMALRAGVPAIALGYEWKTEGIFADLGLPDWHRPINAWTAEEVADMVASLSSYPLGQAVRELNRLGESLENLFWYQIPVLRRVV